MPSAEWPAELTHVVWEELGESRCGLTSAHFNDVYRSSARHQHVWRSHRSECAHQQGGRDSWAFSDARTGLRTTVWWLRTVKAPETGLIGHQ